MAYSIVDFAASLDIERCKVRNTPDLIFLCGGKTEGAGKYKSARDYFYRHLKAKAPDIAARVHLAEVVNEWFRRGEFPDLLELENYLAALADITVLFVESPGSIAELGAFAASDSLRPKTLAVLNELYDSRQSFISDGPVQKLRNENEDLVHYYEWNPKQLNASSTLKEFHSMAADLTEFLMDRDKARTKEQSFEKSEHGHVLLMVANLIEIVGVATTSDIASSLEKIGCDSSLAQVHRYLSLLESMSFIRQRHRSNQAFYIGMRPASFIRYAYKPEAILKDRKRIRAAVREALGFTATLTEIFGLSSSIDKETQRQIDDRNVLARIDKRTEEQERQLIEINDKLGRLGFMFEDREPLYQSFLRAWHDVRYADKPPLSPQQIEQRQVAMKELIKQLVLKQQGDVSQ